MTAHDGASVPGARDGAGCPSRGPGARRGDPTPVEGGGETNGQDRTGKRHGKAQTPTDSATPHSSSPLSASTPIDISVGAQVPTGPLGNPLGINATALVREGAIELVDESVAYTRSAISARYEILRAAQALTGSDALRSCLAAQSTVLMTRKRLPGGTDVVGLAGGIIRCGLLWVCPFCAAHERHARATQVDQHVTTLLRAGHTVMFVVATLSDRMPLDEAMAELRRVQRAMWTKRFIDSLTAFYGYVGRIRSLEVTMRLDATGHPHLQWAIAFDRELTAVEFDDVARMIRHRWLAVTGLRAVEFTPEQEENMRAIGIDPANVSGVPVSDFLIGIRAERVALDDQGKCTVLSAYMVKGSESWTIGAEFNRADVKRSKGGQTFAPFDVLREFAATGDLALRDVWQAYEAATFGLAQLQYSTGFRQYIEKLAERTKASSEVLAEPVVVPDVTELVDQGDEEEDDELVARSEGHVPYVEVEPETWNWCRKRGLLADLISTTAEIADGDDPIEVLTSWARAHGAPLKIATGFDEPDMERKQ
jgi:hypothetical protein